MENPIAIYAGAMALTSQAAEDVIVASSATQLKRTRTPQANGIQFPAVQVASADANMFDDYEENTFTPGMSFGGSAAGVTYGTQTGVYIKVGRLVWFQVRIVLTSNGSGSGSARITGLPFTADLDAAMIVTQYANLSAATAIGGFVEASATTAILHIPGAADSAAATETNVTDTAQLTATGVYRTAN